MDMDGTSPLLIGMGVRTVTKECGGGQKPIPIASGGDTAPRVRTIPTPQITRPVFPLQKWPCVPPRNLVVHAHDFFFAQDTDRILYKGYPMRYVQY